MTNLTWKRENAGYYTSKPFEIIKVNYGYGTEWSLLVDEGGSQLEWCNTFQTLRDAKAAAQAISEEQA